MSQDVREQYEAYPYPARPPGVDGERDVFGPLEELEVLNHFGFGGSRDWTQPFRVLVAGGGTGDASTGIGKQMQDRGIPGEVIYVDLSSASRAVAEQRAKDLNLTNIRFFTGSLLDVGSMGIGEFDYINCSGVLHHLEDPEAGAKALASVLAPNGVLGVMVYGELGRIGVYHAQDMLRLLCGDDPLPAQVNMAKRVLPNLPHSNWLMKNQEQKFTNELDDAEIVDRFLHTCDQAYRVPGCIQLAGAGDLEIAEFVPPLLYRPEVFVSDPAVLAKVGLMDRMDQYAFGELVSGLISRQSFFASRSSAGWPPPVTIRNRKAIPELLPMTGNDLADSIEKKGSLALTLGAVSFSQPLTLTPALTVFLREMDGLKNLEQLAELAGGSAPSDEEFEAFIQEIAPLYNLLNGTTTLVLRRGESTPSSQDD